MRYCKKIFPPQKNIDNLYNKCIVIFVWFRELEALFGRHFWDNTALEFTHWAYDNVSVNKRNHTGQDEGWKTWDINKQLQVKSMESSHFRIWVFGSTYWNSRTIICMVMLAWYSYTRKYVSLNYSHSGEVFAGRHNTNYFIFIYNENCLLCLLLC